MKNKLLFFAALAVSSALCAQENQNFGKEDVLAAFREYNPAALEKAALNPTYDDLLNQVAAAYCAARTENNRFEMIALVKNFDNSLRLQAVREEYANGRTLQMVSGAELAALDERILASIQDIIKNVFKNTLQVREMQIDRYKEQMKTVKKDDSLSKEQQKTAVADLKDKIQTVKTEIKTLKKNSKQKIKDTAKAFFADIRSEYNNDQKTLLLRAQTVETQAVQTDARSVKANHKKPVAE